MKLAWTNDSYIAKGYRAIKTRITSGIIETSKQSNPFGFESNPTKNYVAILSETQSNEEPVIVGYLNPRALESLNKGDSMQYSTDEDGNQKATITIRNTGQVEILGTGDYMVRYNELKTEYDKTKAVLDAILTTLGTPINEPGNGAPSAFQAAMIAAVGSKTTGDISKSKISEIETTPA